MGLQWRERIGVSPGPTGRTVPWLRPPVHGLRCHAVQGYRFRSDIIALAVRWYLRFRLRYAEVAELLANGVSRSILTPATPGCARSPRSTRVRLARVHGQYGARRPDETTTPVRAVSSIRHSSLALQRSDWQKIMPEQVSDQYRVRKYSGRRGYFPYSAIGLASCRMR